VHRIGDCWSACTSHQTEQGVRLEQDCLVWYEQPIFNPHSGGGAYQQSFEEFLNQGPYMSWLSQKALGELTAAVLARAGRKKG
jgi:hypothetical protein